MWLKGYKLNIHKLKIYKLKRKLNLYVQSKYVSRLQYAFINRCHNHKFSTIFLGYHTFYLYQKFSWKWRRHLKFIFLYIPINSKNPRKYLMYLHLQHHLFPLKSLFYIRFSYDPFGSCTNFSAKSSLNIS